MNGTKLVGLVQKGFRKGALKIGLPYAHYRASGPGNPIVPACLMALPVPALFDTGALKFTNPKMDDRAIWTVLLDPAAVIVGDYLVGGNGTTDTWFIADITHPLPQTAIRCNAVVTLSRMPQRVGLGASTDYGGLQRAKETAYITEWPCSMLEAYRGEQSTERLPGKARSDSSMSCLLPALPDGIRPLTGDTMVDAWGIQYLLSAVEESFRGWKIGVIRTNA